MLARDSVESARALPGVWRALVALARRSRNKSKGVSPSRSCTRNGHDHFESPVDVPLVQVVMDAGACREHAARLSVASNTLIMAFSARLALRMGRVDASGHVTLVLPISDRHSDDRRGNALRSITVMADPEACRNDPRALQRDLKAALASLIRHGDDFSPLLPLIPYVPLRLVRRLEPVALGADLPVGCSFVGELPLNMIRACGDPLLLQLSLREHYQASELERLGGVLFIGCYRVGQRLLFTVSGYMPNRVTTHAELAALVRDALADMGLCGTVS